MPRVVPSQIVMFMEAVFPPFLSSETETREGTNAREVMPGSYLPQLAATLTLIEQVPNELITLDGDKYAEMAANLAAMRSILKRWQTDLRTSLKPIPGLNDLNPVVAIHHCLASCPDQFPSPGTTELSFIEPDDLRENLRLDISAANRALANNEWKAATILAGSIVEALLLWALQHQDPLKRETAITTAVGKTLQQKPPTYLEQWHLHQFIEVAAEAKIISADAASQARLAKDFRNLIHPGRSSRLGQICDRGTALAAAAAVEFIVRDLTP